MATPALLVGAVFWGLLWWPLKALDAAGINGSIVQVFAYGLSTLVLLPFVWHCRAAWRTELGLLLIITLMGGWANASLVTALTEGSVVRVMLLFYLAPVWTILAARIFLGEAFTRLRIVALALALAGLAATLGGPELFSAPLSVIDLMALSSGLAFALNNVAIRVGHQLPDSARAAAMLGGCALIALGFMLREEHSVQATDRPSDMADGRSGAALGVAGYAGDLFWRGTSGCRQGSHHPAGGTGGGGVLGGADRRRTSDLDGDAGRCADPVRRRDRGAQRIYRCDT